LVYCQSATAIPLTATTATNNTLKWYTVATVGTSSSTAPTPSATSVGTTNYYVSQTTPQNCEGPRALLAVTVNATPVVGNATATICSGFAFSTNPSGVPANTTYTWTTPVSNPINAITGGSSQVTGQDLISQTLVNTTQNAATLTYTVTPKTGNCPGNTFTIIVTVNPKPIISANAPIICNGKSTTLTASGADTYSWTPITALNTITGSNVTANPTTSTTYTVTGTITATGCLNTAIAIVTVNPLPAAPVVSNVVYCQSNTASVVTATALSGNTLNWYDNSNTLLAGAPTPTTASATEITYLVSQTITATGCEGPKSTIKVTIKPTPAITVSSTSPTSCASATGSITIAGLTTGVSYTVNYTTKNSPVTISNVIPTGNSFVINNLTSGTYSNITATLNGCPSNIAGPVNLVDPTPPPAPTASSISPICSGKTLNLTANTTATGTPTYNWSGPNNFSSNQQNPIILNVTTAAAGIYTVTVTIAACTSTGTQVVVAVDSTPVTPKATSNTPVCSDSTLRLSAGTLSTMAVTWAWTGPNNFNINLQNPTINNVLTAAAGSYSVIATATQGTCASAAGTTTVVVNPTPKITTSSATDPTSCGAASGSIILNGLTANNTYLVNYKKGAVQQPEISLTASASGVLTILNLSAGIYSDIYVVLTGCPSNKMVPITLSDPNPPDAPVITGNDPICSGSNTLTLNATVIVGATYTWTGPNNYSLTITSSTISIVNATVAAGGTYTVTATLNNCTSKAGSLLAVVNPTPPMPSVITPVIYCQVNNTVPLNATTTANTNSLLWYTNSSGGTSSVTAFTPSTLFVGNTLFYVSQITDKGCEGPRNEITVTINATPLLRDTIQTICSGTAFVIAPTFTPINTTYTWDNPVILPTGAITGGTGEINAKINISEVLSNVTSTTATATYKVYPTTGNCPGIPFFITITIKPTPKIQQFNDIICSGENFSISPVDNPATTIVPAGILYSWNVPTVTGAITGGISGNGQTLIFGSLVNPTNVVQTANYSIIPTVENCTGAPFPVIIKVNPKPFIPNNNISICSGTKFEFTPLNSPPLSIVPTGTTYTWPIPISNPVGVVTGGSIQSTGQLSISENLNNNTLSPATLTYIITPVSGDQGSCPGNSFTLTITINPQPGLVNQFDTICSNQTFSITPDKSPAGTMYTWTTPVLSPIGGVSGSSAQQTPQSFISQNLINLTADPVNVTYTVRPISGICSGASFDVLIKVNPSPVIGTQNTAICTNNSFSVSPANNIPNTIVPNGTIYTWGDPVSNPSGSISGGSNQSLPQGQISQYLINNTAVSATLTYSVIPISIIDKQCVGKAFPLIATVHPDAKAVFSYPVDTACWPFSIKIQNLSSSLRNGSYNWYADNNFIGTGINFPGYTILTPGSTVDIKMVAVSLYGCKNDSIIHRFVTKPKPAPIFTVSDTVGCGPLLVSFNNMTPMMNEFTYKWDFANGQTSNLQQPADVIFKSNPTFRDTIYVVRLFAFNECDTQVYRIPILVKSKPNAIFTSDKTTGCSPMTVNFTNGSIGDGMTYKWIFADGDSLLTSSSAPVKHIFYVANQTTFPVQLVATNNCGSDTFTLSIVVTPNTIKLNFSIDGNTVSGCIPHTIRVVNNSTGGNLFVWDFGDGTIFNSINNIEVFTHTYFQSGSFQVSARAINTCSDTTATRSVLVLQKPVPNYTVNYAANCIGDTISFTNSTDTATAYSWNFGDGRFSNAINPKHIYAAPGNYTVKLYARLLHPNGQVCLDSIQKQILIVDHLPGKFNVSDSIGNCTPFTVSFSNESLPSVATTWNFGDNTTGTGNNISHTYTTVGTYTASMTAIDPGGCRYEYSKQIVAGGPNGTLSYTKNTVCGNIPVRFEATAFFTDSLRWNFGDGVVVTTNSRIVFHTYSQPGIYLPTVELLAGAGAGCRILLKGKDTLKVDYLKAGFKQAALKFCDSTRVSFIDSSYAFSGIQNWQWSFGDGSNSTAQNITHTYTSGNNYPINHIIQSKWGCRDTSSIILPVKVATTPLVQINLSNKGCIKETIELKANINSIDSINFVKWTISNGISGNGNNFNVVFNQAGTYTIKVIVGTINGCYDTATTSIIINTIPNISASVNQRICRGQSVQLLATGNDNYQWSPLTGLSCYDCANPIATPIVTTDYIVSTLNAAGCRNSDTVTMTVVQPFKMSLSPNDTICIGQSATLTVSGASNYTWTPAATLSCSTCPNPVATPTLTTLYRVVGKDNFNCFTDTGYTVVAVGLYPTITLPTDKVLSTGTLFPLSSTVTNGPIRSYTWNPTTELSCKDCPLPIATIKKDICYVVKAENFYGCAATDTICIKVFCESAQVFIPNTFTPDGDGINDILMVRATGIKQVKQFTVFNRWGEIVFEKTNFSPNISSVGWDGKIRGIRASADVYVYIAEVVCENDLRYTYKGNVTIIN
jgi:gliding motility-associated-like protein